MTQPAVSISTSGLHSVVLLEDGTQRAWGHNGGGRLGDGTTINRNVPTQIGTSTNWQYVEAGSEHTVAIKSDGSLWAWGYNTGGQLGDGTFISRNTPTQIGTATDWQEVKSGYRHNVARKTDGTIWSWGYNLYGQLGNGTSTDTNTPTPMGSGSDWQTLCGGEQHSLALKTDGELWGWGLNVYGEVGLGNTASFINTPTAIICPLSLSTDAPIATANELRVFPNPAQNSFQISSNAIIDQVAIYNVLGQEVLTKPINGNQSSIDISNFPSGNYILKATSNGLVKTVKMLKK